MPSWILVIGFPLIGRLLPHDLQTKNALHVNKAPVFGYISDPVKASVGMDARSSWWSSGSKDRGKVVSGNSATALLVTYWEVMSQHCSEISSNLCGLGKIPRLLLWHGGITSKFITGSDITSPCTMILTIRGGHILAHKQKFVVHKVQFIAGQLAWTFHKLSSYLWTFMPVHDISRQTVSAHSTSKQQDGNLEGM